MTFLDLSANSGITWRGAVALAELLDTMAIKQHYKRHNIDKSTTGVHPGTSLKHLILDGVPLGDRGAAALCDKLVWNDSLSALSARRCGIGRAGAMALGWLLHENATLEVLRIGEAVVAATALGSNKKNHIRENALPAPSHNIAPTIDTTKIPYRYRLRVRVVL